MRGVGDTRFQGDGALRQLQEVSCFLPRRRLDAAVLLFGVLLGALAGVAAGVEPDSTFCNPLNLDYPFMKDEPTYRMAADPVIVLYQDDYYLFATKAGGYWYSHDFIEWTRLESKALPVDDPAPAVLVIGDTLYFTAFNSAKLYATKDPKADAWREAADIAKYRDPALFLDSGGRVWMCYGCFPQGPIWVVELDPRQGFREVGSPVLCFRSDIERRGWERRGDDTLGFWKADGTFDVQPWIEGSWMTEHNGRYYLQYAAPGTCYTSYADGVFTSSSPTGPFRYELYSPFSHKPSGFITGAGHGNTFQDRNGNLWRSVTMVVSVTHKFERRVGVFPAGFDEEGWMYARTYLGDYPQLRPDVHREPSRNGRAGWMLLSYGKKARASSSLEDHPARDAFDEDVKTFWSTGSGITGEWLEVDLGTPCRIAALQVNFAESGVVKPPQPGALRQRYKIEASDRGLRWTTLLDRSDNDRDMPHDYVQLDKARKARYVRITNLHDLAVGAFSIRDLRLFGRGSGGRPDRAAAFSVVRDPLDDRRAVVTWEPAEGAVGYMVRYGIRPDKLTNHYQAHDEPSLFINSLNAGVDYYFAVDTFNENGVTPGVRVVEIKSSHPKND